MPCRVETDPVRRLTAVRAEGEVGVEEIFSAISRVWREPAYRERAAVLWDLRDARVEVMQAADLRDIVGLEREARPDQRHARMAIVVSTEVGYGMARMIEAMVADEPIDVYVVRNDEEAAWRWLTGPELEGRPA